MSRCWEQMKMNLVRGVGRRRRDEHVEKDKEKVIAVGFCNDSAKGHLGDSVWLSLVGGSGWDSFIILIFFLSPVASDEHPEEAVLTTIDSQTHPSRSYLCYSVRREGILMTLLSASVGVEMSVTCSVSFKAVIIILQDSQRERGCPSPLLCLGGRYRPELFYLEPAGNRKTCTGMCSPVKDTTLLIAFLYFSQATPEKKKSMM